MKKFFSLFAAVLLAGSMMATEELKATLDFTSNTASGFGGAIFWKGGNDND